MLAEKVHMLQSEMEQTKTGLLAQKKLGDKMRAILIARGEKIVNERQIWKERSNRTFHLKVWFEYAQRKKRKRRQYKWANTFHSNKVRFVLYTLFYS